MRKRIRKQPLLEALGDFTEYGIRTFDYIDLILLDLPKEAKPFKRAFLRKHVWGHAYADERRSPPGMIRYVLPQVPWSIADELENKLEGIDYRITHYEPVRDFLFSEQQAADRLQKFFQDRVLLRGHPDAYPRPINFESTLYWADEESNWTFVVYSDRCSKCVRGACCHTEFRFNEAGVKQFGFTSFSDIVAVDHTKLWDENLTAMNKPRPRARTREHIRPHVD